MKKTIIANFGEGDTGKTGSILLVFDKLCKVAEGNPVDREPDKKNKKDVCAWLTINNVKIGIASDGDSQAIVRDNLDFLTAAGCQIIITACSNNHDSVVLLNDYKNEYKYRIWRTSNARIYENGTNPRVAPKGIQTRFNENWATEIANLIESWCYA
jgi:hypothetical protein